MRRPSRRIVVVLAAIGVLVWGAVVMMSVFSRKPESLGVVDGRLAECPSSPNCVSTQTALERHGMAPIPFSGSAEEAMQRVRKVIAGMPRARIVTAEGDYLHVEFRSAVFRFVDDVEFLVDPDEKVIHFRSASRVGYSDLGVNRRRMEQIRAAFEKE